MEKLIQLCQRNENELRKYKIVVVANVRNRTGDFKNISLRMANANEFFSDEEFDEITAALRKLELFTKIYYNELDFFNEILTQKYDPKQIIVLNFARNGTSEGKKSLIPCFCDLLNIKYTGSDAATQALCRNKYIWSSVLLQENLPAQKSCYYQDYNEFDIVKNYLKNDVEYIVKPVSESSSMGVSGALKKNEVLNLLKKSDKKLIIQRFLSGDEYEVPFYELNGIYYPFPPQKINYKGSLLNEELSVLNDYTYTPSDLTDEVNLFMLNAAIKTARLLGIKKYGRIDFKLSANREPYIIDIATLPYITDNSSFHSAVNQLDQPYERIFEMLLTCALLTEN